MEYKAVNPGSIPGCVEYFPSQFIIENLFKTNPFKFMLKEFHLRSQFKLIRSPNKESFEMKFFN